MQNPQPVHYMRIQVTHDHHTYLPSLRFQALQSDDRR
ncbi:hypothetical protein XELAEV_180028121mg, partial [Xenopus laevis]